MKSCDIQRNLMSWVMANTSDIVVPNYYLGRYECDVMKVSKAGLIYEYEIKVSRSDFKRDADKRALYFKRVAPTKHQDIVEGRRCSRFYFVVPENLILPTEVTSGFGLIYATPIGVIGKLDFKIVKVSKQFKKEPVDINFYRHIGQNLTLKLIAAKRRLSFVKDNL